MADNQERKGSLPYGWTVATSKHYKDRIYYFNIFTGASTWECPDLDPPSKESVTQLKSMESKSDEGNSSKNSDMKKTKYQVSESKTPPTAVVAPVIHDKNPVSVNKNEQRKRKSDSEKTESKTEQVGSKKKRKRCSPLNRTSDSNAALDKLLGNSDVGNPLLDESLNTSSGSTLESSSGSTLETSTTSTLETSEDIKDVEMKDVSLEVMDDLALKTVLDTTACYYIVVDTNVLIRELHLISELKDTPLDGCGPPHIFIPWVVIQELDKLKSQKNIKGLSRNVAETIRYLNSVLKEHPRFHGQSPAEAEEWSKSYSKNNDDKILECCIALMDKMPPEKVILLTNDKNLVNKALILKINVHDFESMMKKVKPDTLFDYEELKNDKKKKKEKQETEEVGISEEEAHERLLQSTREQYKREIHSLMSNVHLTLKDVLAKFLAVEMFEAYGSIWLQFPIEGKLLRGILGAIKRYWRSVFQEIFSEKDKRNFELLQEKANRPEGFLGDKDECLIILSAIEDIFKQIQKRRPTIRVPVNMIKECRLACVNAFTKYNDIEDSLRILEDKSILDLFKADWVAMNQLTGLVLDYYNVPNNFDYIKFNGLLPEPEVQRILITLMPEIEQIRNLMANLLECVITAKPTKASAKRLAKSMLQFIPNLQVPHVPQTYKFFSGKALERFFHSSQQREKLENGLKQADAFYQKLNELFYDMLKGKVSHRGSETMICD